MFFDEFRYPEVGGKIFSHVGEESETIDKSNKIAFNGFNKSLDI